MKTLIAYATKCGTSETASKMIDEKLEEKAKIVNLEKEKIGSLEEFDFVLIGGSIYMGRVQGAVKKFLKKNEKALLRKRVGLFLACGEPEKFEDYFNAFLSEKIFKHAEILTSIGFAYYIEKMGPLSRKIVVDMVKIEKTVEDYREKEIDRIAKIING